MLPISNTPQIQKHQRPKVKGLEMICHTNGNHKRAGVAILLPDKIDFETRNLIRQGSTFPISKRVIRSGRYNNL